MADELSMEAVEKWLRAVEEAACVVSRDGGRRDVEGPTKGVLHLPPDLLDPNELSITGPGGAFDP